MNDKDEGWHADWPVDRLAGGDQAGPAAVGVVCAAAAAPQASLTQQIKPVQKWWCLSMACVEGARRLAGGSTSHWYKQHDVIAWSQ